MGPMSERLSDEELERLRADLKSVQGNVYANVELADFLVRCAPSLLDEVREARREAERPAWVRYRQRIAELDEELAAAHESAQGCAEELARVADELRKLKRRCSVPHTWELTTDGKRCLACGTREDFFAHTEQPNEDVDHA